MPELSERCKRQMAVGRALNDILRSSSGTVSMEDAMFIAKRRIMDRWELYDCSCYHCKLHASRFECSNNIE